MFEISKADWKLFRARLPEWQEKYMERLTKEYIELLSSSEPASTRFWELEKRINALLAHDKTAEKIGVIDLSRTSKRNRFVRVHGDACVIIPNFGHFLPRFFIVDKLI